MTEPAARELVDLNALPSQTSRLDARAESAFYVAMREVISRS
jgi:hypothetical protein